jgi:hypothetical protein
MTTATHLPISVSEYLHTSYQPDCDYVDGVIEERNRLEDYRAMGVKNIWVVDPATRRGFDCSTGSWIETAHFAAAGSSIHIDLGAIFAAIDEDHSR